MEVTSQCSETQMAGSEWPGESSVGLETDQQNLI